MKSKPTVAIVLNPKTHEVRRALRLRVTFNREWRCYATTSEEMLTAGEFGNRNLKVVKNAIAKAEDCKVKAEEVIERLGNDFSFDSFRTLYKEKVFNKVPEKAKNDISALFDAYFVEHPNRSLSTRESYETIRQWVVAYKPDCTIEDITPSFITNLEAHIKEEHKKTLKERAKRENIDIPITEISVNTLGIYFRNLKSICNYAVKKGLIAENPFKDYSFKTMPREKRSLTIEEFNSIKNYETDDKRKAFSRDFFILSFLLSGINLGDIFSFKNMDIDKEHLSFERKKTGIRVDIDLTKDAIAIIKKYGRLQSSKPNSYVFPFYDGLTSEEKIRQRKKWLIRKVNRGLAEICEELNIDKATTYNARHTYATFGRDYGSLDAAQLQKMLGHATITTTQTYLDGLTKRAQQKNQSFLDKVMRGELENENEKEKETK